MKWLEFSHHVYDCNVACFYFVVIVIISQIRVKVSYTIVATLILHEVYISIFQYCFLDILHVHQTYYFNLALNMLPLYLHSSEFCSKCIVDHN